MLILCKEAQANLREYMTIENKNLLQKVKPFSLIFSAIVMWALSYPLIKIALNEVPAIMLGALRYIIYLPLLIIVVIFIKKKNKKKNKLRLSREETLIFFSVGAFGFAFPHVFQNIGMRYTTASLSASSGYRTYIYYFVCILFSKRISRYKKDYWNNIRVYWSSICCFRRRNKYLFYIIIW